MKHLKIYMQFSITTAQIFIIALVSMKNLLRHVQNIFDDAFQIIMHPLDMALYHSHLQQNKLTTFVIKRVTFK